MTANYPVAFLASFLLVIVRTIVSTARVLERAHGTAFDGRFWAWILLLELFFPLDTSAWQNICGRLSGVRLTFSSLGFPDEFNTANTFCTRRATGSTRIRFASHPFTQSLINGSMIRAPIHSCQDRCNYVTRKGSLRKYRSEEKKARRPYRFTIIPDYLVSLLVSLHRSEKDRMHSCYLRNMIHNNLWDFQKYTNKF